MRTRILKWGNAAVIRIPAPVLRAARLEVGQGVNLRVERGCIVLEPVRYEQYDLDELVAAITDDNRHDLIDFGEPIGRELRW